MRRSDWDGKLCMICDEKRREEKRREAKRRVDKRTLSVASCQEIKSRE
jgi:hypothetical protein